MAQEVELKGWRFDPQLLLFTCQRVLQQDTVPQIASDGQAMVCMVACCFLCASVCVNGC